MEKSPVEKLCCKAKRKSTPGFLSWTFIGSRTGHKIETLLETRVFWPRIDHSLQSGSARRAKFLCTIRKRWSSFRVRRFFVQIQILCNIFGTLNMQAFWPLNGCLPQEYWVDLNTKLCIKKTRALDFALENHPSRSIEDTCQDPPLDYFQKTTIKTTIRPTRV